MMNTEASISRVIAPDMMVQSLHDVFGPRVLFSPRAPARGSRWLPPRLDLECMTGNQIVICGATPVLCHQSTAIPEGLALLQDVWQIPLPEMYTYRDDADRYRQLRDFVDAGYRIVVQHVHPSEELEPNASWIDPGLLAWLNNKSHLDDLVSPVHRPYRELAELARLRSYRGRYPVVIKAATNLSTGGCHDVRICHDQTELHAACESFRDCDEVVIEEYLELRAVLNLQFTVKAGGYIGYLGVSEQLMTPDNKPAGNWLSSELVPPCDALATAARVTARAAELGYIGFVGIDVGILPDGSGRLLDLNFRLNASTTPLLLRTRLRTMSAQPCAYYASLPFAGDYDAMLRATRRVLDRGWIFPVSFFDSQNAGNQANPPRVTALIPLENREHLNERHAQLAECGFIT